MTLPAFVKPHPDGVLLSVNVQPRASRNEIGKPLGDTLRIRVTAPPVDSAANDAVVKLLAGALGIGRGSVKVVRGRTSRHKLIRILGLTPDRVRGTLQGD